MADPAAVQRLVDERVAQGHPRTVTDPAVLDRVAGIVRRGIASHSEEA